MGGLRFRDQKVLPHHALAFLGIGANAIGNLLYRPLSPDVTQGSFFPAFLLFLSYLIAQIGWGSLLSKAMAGENRIWESFFLGSGFFSLAVGILGFFSLVGENAFPFWNFFLLAGCGALFFANGLSLPACFQEKAGKKIAALGILVCCLSILGSFSPHPFFDSLWYHLSGSRFWFEAHRIYAPETFPIALNAGFWDYHFLLGQILLGSDQGGGLIAAHLFGQWANLAMLCFSFLLLCELAEKLELPLEAALLAFLGTELFFEAEFAKNDWAAVFYGLCALHFFVTKRAAALIGLSSGICFATKFSSGFFLAPLMGFFVWERRKSSLFPLLLVMGAACSPLLLRNLFLVGNPFFPALQNFFPNHFLGPSWQSISLYEGVSWGSSLFWKLRELVRDSSMVIAVCFLPFAWKKLTKAKIAFVCTGLSLVLFLFFSGPKAEWRLVGAALPVFALLAAAGLILFLRAFSELAVSAALVASLAYFPVHWRSPQEFLGAPDASLQIRSWAAGPAMAWARLNAKPGDRVATLNEQRIYYLFPLEPLRVFDHPGIDAALNQAATPSEAIVILQKQGIRFLVLSAEFLDRYYNRKVCDWFYQISESHPEATVFRSELSRVLDLSRL